jgi:hypothetical protein
MSSRYSPFEFSCHATVTQTNIPTMTKVLSLLAGTAAAATLMGAAVFVAAPSSSQQKQLFQSLRRNLQGKNGSPTSAYYYPLRVCEADCDTDYDCQAGLICFQHNGSQSIPGCVGADPGMGDYCVRPNAVAANSSSTTSTKSTNASATLLPLDYVFNNGAPWSVYPLQRCQGDCDNNKDCAGDLICFQRGPGMAVPGCKGIDMNPYDYCIDTPSTTGTANATSSSNTASVAASNATSSNSKASLNATGTSKGVGLKIYWQKGYYWQEETFERKWCMRCDSSNQSCAPGRKVFLTNCDTDMITKWELKYVTSKAFQIKIAAADLCLTVPIDTQNKLTVETCDATNNHQLYFAQNGQAKWGNRFEINPVWAPNGCVGNTHHPKYGEALYLWDCQISRWSTTSLWNFY